MTIQDAAFAATTASPTEWSRGSRSRPPTIRPTTRGLAEAHAAVVEVDTGAGDARLVRYVAVDDVGSPINPQIIDGQVRSPA